MRFSWSRGDVALPAHVSRHGEDQREEGGLVESHHA
eukprot:CAMPEP_0183538020 /NCGR_PEP_ID=MMETSP0371-20130417/29307_1 /TAXON_ID=268820 /ORGANISM="Peridinium aciculiferum, Strain PAER-2" /LENGTH=35 /DNA_ID= /DNA_START= /DNA_END= /DNA_ORIENTATION=